MAPALYVIGDRVMIKDGPFAWRLAGASWTGTRSGMLPSRRSPRSRTARRHPTRSGKEFARAKDFIIKAGVIGVKHPFMWWAGKPVRGFARTFPNFGQTAENPRDKLGTNGAAPIRLEKPCYSIRGDSDSF